MPGEPHARGPSPTPNKTVRGPSPTPNKTVQVCTVAPLRVCKCGMRRKPPVVSLPPTVWKVNSAQKPAERVRGVLGMTLTNRGGGGLVVHSNEQ